MFFELSPISKYHFSTSDLNVCLVPIKEIVIKHDTIKPQMKYLLMRKKKLMSSSLTSLATVLRGRGFDYDDNL